jgi:osmotically-inducible protein OsmY
MIGSRRSAGAIATGASGDVRSNRRYREALSRQTINFERKLMVVMAVPVAPDKLAAIGDVMRRARKSFCTDEEPIMKSDEEIERDVREELKWDPDLDASDIAVSVKGGVVTLVGFVKSYSDRLEAEAAAKRVAGVKAVANDLEVRLPAIDQRPDPDIARDAVTALKAELPISHDRIKLIVKDGWVTLEGAVEWQYQKTTAENAVRKVKGVKGVTNVIAVKPKVEPSELKRKIMEAFKRNAEVDANRITVEANGSEVILKGTVRSWIEREEAERVAWSAPGVTKVEDRIVVSP